ncbi:unnamed protein product [Ectocarpus sp. 8 AP-2014]
MSASDSAFAAAVDAGALSLVTDLTEDASDVLLQLNALDLLDQVASTAGGARHLVANGHLDRLLVAAGGGRVTVPTRRTRCSARARSERWRRFWPGPGMLV